MIKILARSIMAYPPCSSATRSISSACTPGTGFGASYRWGSFPRPCPAACRRTHDYDGYCVWRTRYNHRRRRRRSACPSSGRRTPCRGCRAGDHLKCRFQSRKIHIICICSRYHHSHHHNHYYHYIIIIIIIIIINMVIIIVIILYHLLCIR